MARPVKYFTPEQKEEAHREAQRRHLQKKKAGVPTRKKTDPKKFPVSNGDAPFTFTGWNRAE